MTEKAIQLVDAKHQREKDFHDQWAKTIRLEDLKVRETFEAPTAIENHYALRQLGDLKGKKILDLGCGAGETSVYLAMQGAQVYACDIAEEFLKIAGALAEKHGVRLNLQQVEASRLPYAEGAFDFVYGNGVLHHVDLLPTAQEIHRVLKPGGKAVFIEPLPYNPLIQLYRWMAKAVRTEDEKPLTFGQLKKAGSFFSSFRHEEFWFFSLFIFFHFFFIRRWNPSKVRYWKKVIEEGENYKEMFSRLERFDRSFLRAFPFMKPLCWNTVLVATK